MHGLKRGMWRLGIVLAGLLLFLVLMVWVSAADAYEETSGLAMEGTPTVQATPTVDATVTALNKEKLRDENNWLWSNGATIVSSVLSTLVIVSGALIAFWRWRGDQRTEQDKRSEERFQEVVEGLASEKIEAKLGAAITLRTFLKPGYEQFYLPAFHLAVAHLRLTKVNASRPQTRSPLRVFNTSPTTSTSSDSLSQAFISVFKESFELNSNIIKKEFAKKDKKARFPIRTFLVILWLIYQRIKYKFTKRSPLYGRPSYYYTATWLESQFTAMIHRLDAAAIHLENGYLLGTNLHSIWLPGAYLQGADLRYAILISANLSGTDFSGADLSDADLTRANLTDTNIEEALSLKDADLTTVNGLTREQLLACKDKGARVDQYTLDNAPRSTVSPSTSAKSRNAQTPSTPPAQATTPPPSTDGINSTSAQPSAEP